MAMDAALKVTKEDVAAKLEELATLTDEAGNNPALTEYLQKMAKLYRYSPYNSMWLAMQMAQRGMELGQVINSKTRWVNDFNREVVATERWRGLAILCPNFKWEVNEKTGKKEQVMKGFSTGYVYAESQTAGDPMPKGINWAKVSDDTSELYDLLVKACDELNITLKWEQTERGTYGWSDCKGTICLSTNMIPDRNDAAPVLIHEMAHSILHTTKTRADFTTGQRECQVEAASYVIMSLLGMTNPNSPSYLALYSQNGDSIKSNLEHTMKGVSTIMKAMEKVAATTTTAQVAA